MAKEQKRPYWQICLACDRRVYSAEPQQCSCNEERPTPMLAAAFHPDNPQPSPSRPAKAPEGKAG